MRFHVSELLIIIFISLVSKASMADPVTFAFQGVVTSTNKPGPFPLGQSISGQYTFDSSVADTNPFNTEQGSYIALEEFSFVSGGYSVDATLVGDSIFINRNTGFEPQQYQVYMQRTATVQDDPWGPEVNGEQLVRMRLLLRGGTQQPIDSIALPVIPPDLSEFDYEEFGLIYESDPTGDPGVKFSVTSLALSGDTSDGALVSSGLPTSRSVMVGNAASAYATIINADNSVATDCSITPLTTVSATFLYQTTDPATNALIGTPDTPVDIAAGGLQTFLFTFTPTAQIAPTEVQLSYDCANKNPAPVTMGLNTLLLSASSTPVPDIVALTATPTGDGTLRLPGASGSNAFAVASVNVGATGTITATPDFGIVNLPIALSICETNPATGACLGPASASVTTAMPAAATPTFAIFATAVDSVTFDPSIKRIFIRFTDAGGITRGASSVAVTTVP